MAFKVYLGSVSKKINSTLVPDTSGWHSVDAVWKRDKDLDHPSIELYLPDVDSPQWNYMYVPSQRSYYWITGIVTVGVARWVFNATLDYLATYKAQIMATPCFIEYGFNVNSGAAGTRVKDDRQAISMVPAVYTQKADITGGNISWTSGVYVLGAIGAKGGVTMYMVSHQQLSQILSRISRDITDAIENLDYQDVIKYLGAAGISQGSAAQAIRSCIWLPLSRGVYKGSSQPIYLGDFNTGVNGIVVDTNQIYIQDTTVSIPWPVADWKRMNCQINVYVPYDGTISIPVDQCNNQAALNVRWCVDLVTGSTSVRINAGDYTVHTSSGNLGVPYGIGVSNVPLQNFISGTAAYVGNALTAATQAISSTIALTPIVNGGMLPDYGGAAAGVTGSISSMAQAYSAKVQSITPVVQGSGTLGGSAAVGQHSTLELTLLYYAPLDDAGVAGRYGYPVFRTGTPVAGYCKTRGFSLAAAARADEISMINRSMDEGVFIE